LASAAQIGVGLEDSDEPFYEESVTVAGDGSVSAVVPIRGAGVEPGAALAVVVCGDETGETPPVAYGFADFTITAAPAAPRRPPRQRPGL
jgi:hypothetical protein